MAERRKFAQHLHFDVCYSRDKQVPTHKDDDSRRPGGRWLTLKSPPPKRTLRNSSPEGDGVAGGLKT